MPETENKICAVDSRFCKTIPAADFDVDVLVIDFAYL
jgi:hypothetical protein